MRGEDVFRKLANFLDDGSPPHARGRPSTNGCLAISYLDHPRMRGEDLLVDLLNIALVGSPPHARGRRCRPTAHVCASGITPACAGKTSIP